MVFNQLNYAIRFNVATESPTIRTKHIFSWLKLKQKNINLSDKKLKYYQILHQPLNQVINRHDFSRLLIHDQLSSWQLASLHAKEWFDLWHAPFTSVAFHSFSHNEHAPISIVTTGCIGIIGAYIRNNLDGNNLRWIRCIWTIYGIMYRSLVLKKMLPA